MGLFSDILLTVDFDRTLTAPDSSIPPRNLEAIRYFIGNDGAFTVNTGRSVPMTRVFREQVPVNAPLLLYNGSAAFDPATGGMTFCHEIPMDQAETIRTCQAAYPDLTVEIQGLDAHYVFSENPGWVAFSESNRCAWAYAKPEDALGPFLKFSLYGQFRDGSVASLFTGTPEEIRRIDQVEADLRRRFAGKVEVFRSAPRILDIHAAGVSKAKSARQLQAQLGRRVLVCVGDAENDLPMLREADYAFAPADGIIAGAFPTVCPCGDGAVADVIYDKIPEIVKIHS